MPVASRRLRAQNKTAQSVGAARHFFGKKIHNRKFTIVSGIPEALFISVEISNLRNQK
jgi:hypothetical protein